MKDNKTDTYEAIESNMDEINGGLKAAQPNSEKLLTALQSLDINVTDAKN